MKPITTLLTAAALFATNLPMLAQQKRVSPHDTVSTVVDGGRVVLVYGRPFAKDPKSGAVRKIWGSLVPYGKVWRTGSDEATIIALQKSIVIGGTTIPTGAYTLFTLPQEDGPAKLIFNKQVGQWGVGPGAYDEKLDVARVDLKKETVDPAVEEFTMAVEKNPSGGGLIALTWENTRYSVGFTLPK